MSPHGSSAKPRMLVAQDFLHSPLAGFRLSHLDPAHTAVPGATLLPILPPEMKVRVDILAVRLARHCLFSSHVQALIRYSEFALSYLLLNIRWV
jgi:hypothetical protein